MIKPDTRVEKVKQMERGLLPKSYRNMQAMLSRYFMSYDPDALPPIQLKDLSPQNLRALKNEFSEGKTTFGAEAAPLAQERISFNKKSLLWAMLDVPVTLSALGLATLYSYLVDYPQSKLMAALPQFAQAASDFITRTSMGYAALGMMIVSFAAGCISFDYSWASNIRKTAVEPLAKFYGHLEIHLQNLKQQVP